MATLHLEHIPDALITQIQQLAQQNHQSIDAQVLCLLKQALTPQKTLLNPLISSKTDPNSLIDFTHFSFL